MADSQPRYRKTDENGTPWALASEVRRRALRQPPCYVRCDESFGCMPVGQPLEVKIGDLGDLYVECTQGRHFLQGNQCEDYYLGFYGPVEKTDETQPQAATGER